MDELLKLNMIPAIDNNDQDEDDTDELLDINFDDLPHYLIPQAM